jgi:hypothetical protein
VGIITQGTTVNRRIRSRLVTTASAAGWALLACDAFISDETLNLTDGQSVLTATVAATGSLVLAGWARSRPVSEIHDIAYQAGRRQGRIDATVTRNGDVIPFRSRAEG